MNADTTTTTETAPATRSVKMATDLHYQYRLLASENDVSLQSLIEGVCRDALDRGEVWWKRLITQIKKK